MPVELRGVVFKGLYETHIDVVDLDRSVGFYEDVLQLELGVKLAVDAARADSHSRGARRVAIMWIGGQGHAALGLWERPADRINVQHFALELEWPEMLSVIAYLDQRGIELRDFEMNRTTTPSVFASVPAASIYFDDPDGHLLEIVAKLPGVPRPELGIVSMDEWNRGDGDT